MFAKEHTYTETLCAVHLQFAQLYLRLPNTAGVTRISNIAPKVGANFTQVQIKLSGLFFLAFGHQSHFAKEKNLSYRLGH